MAHVATPDPENLLQRTKRRARPLCRYPWLKVVHNDGTLAVVERDGAKAYIVASPEYAAKDRPEIAIETDTIFEVYEEIRRAARRCCTPMATW